MSVNDSGARRRSPVMRIALIVSALVLLLAFAAFYYASRLAQQRHHAGGDAIEVRIQAKQCEPNEITVPAGLTRFVIVNQSDRAVEWEILDGVLVVEERENIAPGMQQPLQTKLSPGDYAITCGLLSNPRGVLHVTPTAESAAEASAAPTVTAFVGPLSEYRFFLNMQSQELLDATAALQQAIAAGDVAAAKAAYAQARVAYQQLAATAQRFGELDNRINARADYYAGHEQDAGFGGFHHIEYGLFDKNSTEGLTPVATQLASDVEQLRTQLLNTTLPPQQLAGNAARLLQTLADIRLNGEEERYSHLDLAGFAANLEGVQKVITLLEPLLKKPAPQLVQTLQANIAAAQQTLAPYRTEQGFLPYNRVDDAGRQRIGQAVRQLLTSVQSVNAALGLE